MKTADGTRGGILVPDTAIRIVRMDIETGGVLPIGSCGEIQTGQQVCSG